MPKKNPQKSNPPAGGKKLPIILVPLFLFAILLSLTAINLYTADLIDRNKLNNSSYNFRPSQYPVFIRSDFPYLSARGAVIMDSETKKVLYEKNKGLRFSPASTTKIMTALTALEYYKLNDILTVPIDSKADSIINLQRGDKFRFIDLMYAMMLPSDNRVSETIARNYKGGEEKFVKKMNDNAKIWHLDNTYFADPAGLLDDLNYTSAYDLAILSSIAMENETLRNIVSTKSTTISDSKNLNTYELQNLNILLGSEGIIGLKTGHTDVAGDVLVTAKDYGGHLIIMVVLNSEDRFQDTKNLLKLIKDKINYLTIHP